MTHLFCSPSPISTRNAKARGTRESEQRYSERRETLLMHAHATSTVTRWKVGARFFFSFPFKTPPITTAFIQLAFSDLATKRESAWMTGVETVLF